MKRIFIITGIMFLLIAISFGILGIVFQKQGNRAKGIQVGTGYFANGEYHKIDSGTIGGNKALQNDSETAAIIFYVCAGISAIMGVVFLLIGVIRYAAKDNGAENYKSIYEDKNLRM